MRRAAVALLAVALLASAALGADFYRTRWTEGTTTYELNVWVEDGFVVIQHIACYPVDPDGAIGCSVGSEIRLLPDQARALRKQIRRLLDDRSIANGLGEVTE
jgi:hypothetical protein